jgi:hypothetical protein
MISGFIRLVIAVGLILAAISFSQSSDSAWATVISDVLNYMESTAVWIIEQFR